MRVNLVLLANGTALDVAADEGSKAGPPEFGSNQLSSFQEAGVSGGFMITATFKDGSAEGVVCGDVDAALVSKDDASFDLPVSEPGTEGKRDVLVHRLEGLENERVSRGCGFNVVGEGGVNQVDKEGRWEEGDVSVVRIVRGEEVGSAREGIGTSKKFTRDMDHFQVNVSKVDEPACLVAIERLGLVEIGKVLVVSEDLHREGGAMKIVAPGFQGADNSKEFSVVDIVVPLGGGEGLREVGARLPIAVGVSLEEDGARHVFGCVGGNGEGGGEVREAGDRFCEEKTFEGIKGGLACGGPIPRETFLSEIEERASDVGIVRDESPVEIGEAKERADVFHLGGGWPTGDSIEFDRVHGQLAGFDDHAEVFYLVGGKLAFLEF